MMKLFTALLLAALSVAASADDLRLAPYGTAKTFDFRILAADGTYVTNATDGGTDVTLTCDDGTPATATNDFADEGSHYSIALTATELQCARLVVDVADATPNGFIIETYGNASAQHVAFAANVTQYGGTAGTFASGRPETNTSHIAGSAVSTSSAQIGVNVVNAGGTAWGSGAITAAAIATDAITNTKIAADAIGASELAADAIGAAEIANAAIDAATFATGAIDAAAIATDAIGAAEIAANAIGAAEVADGAIDEATFASTAGSFDALGIIDQGTAQSATGTTVVLRAAAAFADDTLIGRTICVLGSTQGYWQCAGISDSVLTTDTVTVPTWTVTPSGTITYKIWGTAAGTGSVTVASGGITAASFAAGAIDAAAIAADAIGASEIASAAIDADAIASVAIGAAEIGTAAIDADAIATDAIGNAELAADAGAGLSSVPWNAAWDAEVQSEAEDAINVRLEQQTLADAAVINCTVNTAFFAGSTTTVACILTDRDAGAITAASNDLEGRELLILSGAQIYEGRYITDSTWDGANSELRLTLSRALPGTLADAVTAIIR